MSHKEFNCKLNCSDYCLHKGDRPIAALLQEVSLCFDKECGALHKHGSPESVTKWFNNTREKFTSSGFKEMADDLMVITGRFPLKDLNKCLTNSGYVLKMYKKMQAGELAQESEFPTKNLPITKKASSLSLCF